MVQVCYLGLSTEISLVTSLNSTRSPQKSSKNALQNAIKTTQPNATGEML